MSWRVIDPAEAAHSDVRVATVDLEALPDDADALEQVMGRSMSTPADRDFFLSGGLVLLCASRAYDEVRALPDRGPMAGPRYVASELRRLAAERSVCALRWYP